MCREGMGWILLFGMLWVPSPSLPPLRSSSPLARHSPPPSHLPSYSLPTLLCMCVWTSRAREANAAIAWNTVGGYLPPLMVEFAVTLLSTASTVVAAW